MSQFTRKVERPLLAAAILAALVLSIGARAATEPAGKVVGVSGKVLARDDKGTRKMREMKTGDAIEKGEIINTDSRASIKLLMSDRSIVDLGPSSLFKVDEYQLKNGPDRDVQMSLDYGTTRMSVNRPVGDKGKFVIRTKSATMGVRGTEFIVASDLKALPTGEPPAVKAKLAADNKAVRAKGAGPERSRATTSITVIHGKVEVSETTKPKATPVAVTEGKQITTTAAVVGDKAVIEAPGAGAKGTKAEAPKLVDVPPTQMQALTKSVKLEDTTFKQAVVIDHSAGGSGGGAATLAAVSESLAGALAGFTAPRPGDITTPGTFGNNFGSTPPLPPQPGIPVRLQVVFTK